MYDVRVAFQVSTLEFCLCSSEVILVDLINRTQSGENSNEKDSQMFDLNNNKILVNLKLLV